ncbi:flocculation protein FLO11-like [Haliotis rubra]|uniref:flocculation protein FLO11-like n=1 Tax=Haliotis rubra TaxID=36100 RepID=UPI001EE5791C|nr:flocculation protein FLO11-like [Haliotis rubra]
MNSSLSPDEVMKKMDVNCNLPSDKVIEDDSLSLVPQAASTSVTTVQDKDNEVPVRAGDGSQKNSSQPVPLLPSLNPTAASDVPVRAGDGSQKNSSQPVPLLPSPNPTAASDEHITSPRSRSSRTCRHCRHKCRCDSISSLKKRVERLEKMLHQAPQSSQSSPAAPVPPPSDSHQSALCLVREPSQTQQSNHTSPAECLPFSVETA